MNELKFTWAEAGPIIEREGITICQNYGSTTWWAVHPSNELEVHGATALEAAMRAYVHAKQLEDEEPPEPEFSEPRGKLLRDYTTDDFNPKMKHWSDK